MILGTTFSLFIQYLGLKQINSTLSLDKLMKRVNNRNMRIIVIDADSDSQRLSRQ